MSALVIAALFAALWAAYGWPAAALGALACTAVFISTATTLEGPNMPDPANPATLRRRLARFLQLGILADATEADDEHGRKGWRLTTPAGDTSRVLRGRELAAYLDGLAHAAHAAKRTLS